MIKLTSLKIEIFYPKKDPVSWFSNYQLVKSTCKAHIQQKAKSRIYKYPHIHTHTQTHTYILETAKELGRRHY